MLRLRYLCSRNYDKDKILGIIRDEIDKIEYTLTDLYELDFLANYAMQDFIHYFYCKKGYYVKKNFNEDKARLELCKAIIYHEDKIRRIVSNWISWWLVKWKQRVRIVFTDRSDREDDKEMGEMNEELKKIEKEVLNYHKRLAITALVNVNEICSLDIISDYLVKSEYSLLMNEYGVDKALDVINHKHDVMKFRIIKRAVDIAKSTKPLVLLKVKLNSTYH